MNIPDVEGFVLGRALEVLRSSVSFELEITVTGPPGKSNREYNSDFRVARVREVAENKLELLVCDMEK